MNKKNENVKNYVGIDLGKRSLECVRIIPNGKYERFRCTVDEIGKLFKWLNKNDMIAMETGNQAFRIAKQISNKVECEVVVLNAGDLATIYRSLKKTDKEDALKLARMIQRIPKEELPEVKIPSDDEEDARSLSSEQAFYSKMVSKLKNRLHSLLTEAGIITTTRSMMNDSETRRELVSQLKERFMSRAKRILRTIEEAEKILEEVKKEIEELMSKNKEYAKLTMSMPGIGLITTLALFSFVGDCSRFSKGKQVSYYVGLVPRVDISGNQVHYGNIIKRGCKPIRRVIIQCAWALVRSRYGGKLKDFYERKKVDIGKKKAIVAVARKMLEVLFAMFKNGEYYRGMPEEEINKKLKMNNLI